MADILMVIAPDRFRDEELFDTRQELEIAGHTVQVASTRLGRCVGSKHGVAEATLTLAEADPAAFDAVVFVGGPGAEVLFDDPRAQAVARAMDREHKTVAAICVAPMILAKAGLLTGRHASVFASEVAKLEACGARSAGEGVTLDGNLVTASGPAEARRFGRAIAARLGAGRMRA